MITINMTPPTATGIAMTMGLMDFEAGEGVGLGDGVTRAAYFYLILFIYFIYINFLVFL